jgi:hypothetical protein
MPSIDHAQGDGNSDRKTPARRKLCKRIERGDVEPGRYAVLYLSCNQSKGRE